MAISDTLTTRAALRRAVLADLVERCEGAAVPIEGGTLDGIEVVSLGTLREQVAAALEVDLPAPSTKYAEVVTPAHVLVSAICPECGLPAEIVVSLSPQLTVDNDGAELAVKAKTKARVHVCGQLSLSEVADQQDFGLGDIVGELPSDEAVLDALSLVATDARVKGWSDTVIAEWSDLDKRLAYAWAVARQLADADHPEGCSAHFALDATSGERVCDCGLAAAVPPLPAILGGESPDSGDEDEGRDEGEPRPCPACGATLRADDTHWSLFPEPMGGYVCPTSGEGEGPITDENGDELEHGAPDDQEITVAPDDETSDAGDADFGEGAPNDALNTADQLGFTTEPEDDCPFPGCALSAEHAGDHAVSAKEDAEVEARIDTIYSRAADRVAEKRAARRPAGGFTPAQAAQAAAELERDLDGPVH